MVCPRVTAVVRRKINRITPGRAPTPGLLFWDTWVCVVCDCFSLCASTCVKLCVCLCVCMSEGVSVCACVCLDVHA